MGVFVVDRSRRGAAKSGYVRRAAWWGALAVGMLSLLGPTPSVGSDEVESERRESPPGIPNADAFYVKNVKAAEDIQALRGDLFGDQVSLQTGSTEFRHVDVSVPTNGEVAVTLGRKYRVRFESLAGFTDPPDYSSHVVGADWVLDVPYITGTFEQRQYLSLIHI